MKLEEIIDAALKIPATGGDLEVIQLLVIQLRRFETALRDIHSMDYRGNRPEEQVIAYNALLKSMGDIE